jgi:hypothetical protein
MTFQSTRASITESAVRTLLMDLFAIPSSTSSPLNRWTRWHLEPEFGTMRLDVMSPS